MGVGRRGFFFFCFQISFSIRLLLFATLRPLQELSDKGLKDRIHWIGLPLFLQGRQII